MLKDPPAGKEKIAAIIPALNEEKTIKDVLKVIINSGYFHKIIVVDGASKDKTAKIAKDLGVDVIVSKEREGKGMAMKKGIEMIDCNTVAFFDADLIGLTKEHINQIITPVLNGEVSMCTGERGRLWSLPYIIAKIDPLMAIGGERALQKSLFSKIPEKLIQGFAVETALNYYCKKHNIPHKIVKLEGLKLLPKEKKWGLVRGFAERILEVWQIMRIRLIIIFRKDEFI